MTATCPHCSIAIRGLDDACPACGKLTGQRPPWYAYALGAFLVLLIFLWLADFEGLARFVAGLGRLFQP